MASPSVDFKGLKEKLRSLETESSGLLASASTSQAVEEIRVRFLGKKGSLSEVMAQLRSFSAEEKKELGQIANEVRAKLESEIESRAQKLSLAETNLKLEQDSTDASLPGQHFVSARRHPLSQVMNEAVGILERAGLVPVYGPEVEYEEYCFDKLNFKQGHAARDMQATFFMKGFSVERPVILRTHTSPVQVRTLLEAAKKNFELPIRIQVPGRVYRVDDDATHAPMFHQIEGLAVDQTSGMGDLRAVLDNFMRHFFGAKAKVRFRPSYFPFVEPGAEVDVSCVFCQQKGCRVCKQSGWIEVAGAGLVHPEVFSLCGWNPQKVQGWAFGMGVERLAMLKLGIPDLRLFFDNRLRFLRGAAS